VRIPLLVLVFSISLPTLSANLQQAIDDCRVINEAAKRLACYDQLSTLVPTQQDTKTVDDQVIMDTPIAQNNEATTTFTDKFADFFGFEEKEIAKRIPDAMDVFVKNVSSSNGKLIIRLENGQVWQQIDSKYYRYEDSKGQAYIQKGALGSFFFSQKDTKTRIRVRRQQ